MYSKDQSIYLVQKAPVGYLQFKISEQEQRMLKLLLAPGGEVFNCWKELWDIIDDYEALDFSCKDLMPAAVRKVQLCVPQNLWQPVCGGNADFLIGLPRFVWTKNQYVISQAKVILKQLLQHGIEVISIKGISEILSSAELSFMRTTRDIDLLIKKEDLNKSTAILKETGWVKEPTGPDGEFVNNLIEYHSYAYRNAGVIIELDLHVAAISGMYTNTDSFTKYIWDGADVLNSTDGLIVPNPGGRLLIAVANIHNIDNWLNGHYCKYILDAAGILSTMDQVKIDKCIDDGSRLLKMGNEIEQLIDIVGELKASINRVKTSHTEVVKSKGVFFNVTDGLLYSINNLKSTMVLFNTWVSGRNMLRIPLYLFFKFFKKILINPIKKIKERPVKPTATDIPKTKRINITRWYLSNPG